MKQAPLPTDAARPIERPAWQRYGFAALMLVAAVLTRLAMDPYTVDAVPVATTYTAVAFAVWFGGWRPAVVLMIVGYVVGLWWFFPPRHTFKLWETFGLSRSVIYFTSCSISIYLCESLRRAQRRHATSEAQVVAILDQMHECFCSVDAGWRVTSVNRMAEDCFGVSRRDAVGREWWDLVPELAETKAEQELRRALRERVSVQFETNALSIGVWHAVNAAPSPEGLSIFFQDITAKKARVDQLERLVDDRTAALQRLVTELEAFSYMLVHDMRAPLRSISGFADLLAADQAAELTPAAQSHLGRIQNAVRRMDQLIVDVLDYSRLSRGRPVLRSIDLDRLVRELLRAYPQFQLDHADIEIEGVLPKVHGNDALLTQCFSNLLHNATKFVAPGVKPRVRITAKILHDTARIEVADNGIGIAPEAMGRIFDPFHREDAHYEGTGIGLAIVRKVVDLLEGDVGVQSELGRGSRFWVDLKLTAPAALPTPASPS